MKQFLADHNLTSHRVPLFSIVRRVMFIKIAVTVTMQRRLMSTGKTHAHDLDMGVIEEIKRLQ